MWIELNNCLSKRGPLPPLSSWNIPGKIIQLFIGLKCFRSSSPLSLTTLSASKDRIDIVDQGLSEDRSKLYMVMEEAKQVNSNNLMLAEQGNNINPMLAKQDNSNMLMLTEQGNNNNLMLMVATQSNNNLMTAGQGNSNNLMVAGQGNKDFMLVKQGNSNNVMQDNMIDKPAVLTLQDLVDDDINRIVSYNFSLNSH